MCALANFTMINYSLSKSGHHTNILLKDFMWYVSPYECHVTVGIFFGTMWGVQPLCFSVTYTLPVLTVPGSLTSMAWVHHSYKNLANHVIQIVANTCDNRGFQLVSFLISVTCSGEESGWSINNTICGGSGTVGGAVDKRSWLSVSAFEWAVDFLNYNLYS